MLSIVAELKVERDLLLQPERSNISSLPKASFSALKIRLKKDFEYLRLNSKKLSSPALSLYYCENNLGHLRFATSLSAKKFNAVNRNRIKRILREFIKSQPHIRALSLDVLVVFFQPLENAKMVEQIERSFQLLSKK